MAQPEEWEHHVRHTRVDLAGTAWCGVLVGHEWCFVDVDHLVMHRLNRGRLLPCPACLKAIVEAITGEGAGG